MGIPRTEGFSGVLDGCLCVGGGLKEVWTRYALST
jgi:hypothetical protein